ncbi:MAG: hypothetical protein AAGI63_08920 [Planctomycetota bacterium]
MSNDDRLSILITEGSSGSAKETIYCLADQHAVDFVDPTYLCQCRFSRWVRKAIPCPHFATQPDEYLRFLVSTLRRGRYDVLFPVHEDVYLLSYVRESLEREFSVALPDFDTLRSMQSKSDFVGKLNELQIPVPRTQIVDSFDELHQFDEFPVFVKLAHSTAGTGVALVKNGEELREVADRFEREGRLAFNSKILMQQPASGIMSVVQAVFQQGQLIAAHCAETLLPGVGGAQGMRVSASHPKVVQYVKQLGRHLNWHGAMFLEYFYEPSTGEPQFIECNPRIGETYNAKLSGVNLCDLMVRISLGETVEPLVQPVNEGVCSYTDFFLLIQKALTGSPRRVIFRESFQMLAGRGAYQNAASEITHPKRDPLSLIPATAVVMQLLLSPRIARKIVDKTVGSYSLPQSGVETIHGFSDAFIEECFAK